MMTKLEELELARDRAAEEWDRTEDEFFKAHDEFFKAHRAYQAELNKED
tara:strand:+ start:29 stop:175 length:147 start_codon:yes stop_codon:yes gene_type:complete